MKKQKISREKQHPYMRLGHEPCAQGMAKHDYAPSHAPGACWERVRNNFFFHILSGKACSQTSGGNSPYKYHSSRSWFFIQNYVVQEEGKH